MLIGRINDRKCIENIVQSFIKDDWITHLNSIFAVSQMTKHAYLTIFKRIRKVPTPRRLLVIGASTDEMHFWHSINSGLNDGYTCFVVRDLLEDYCKDYFISFSFEIENKLNDFIDVSDFSYLKNEGTDASRIPWDTVILNDICSTNELTKTLKSSSSPCLFNEKCFLEKQLNCTQAYINHAAQLVSDHGYVFIYIPNPNSTFLFNSISFDILENKFLYRHHISPHVGFSGALFYYTSQVCII